MDKTIHNIYNIVMSVIYGGTAVWCLTLLCSLMALQSSADRQRHRFHGYRKPESAVVLFEGIFVICIYVLCFGFILTDDVDIDLIDYSREIAILMFNIVQLFMLFPLRKIAVEPDITKNYFLDPKKKKYVNTFQWISVLNFTTFIYAFIFIANTFAKKLQTSSKITMLSYTFTFCMPYFSIWSIAQYDKWVKLTHSTLPYQESEYSVHYQNPPRSASINATYDYDEKKEEISSVNVYSNRYRDRNQSEAEMSMPSMIPYGNDIVSLVVDVENRTGGNTIQRSKFQQRRRQSEGGRPLDMNSSGQHARTPSIPENYNDTMILFDKNKFRETKEVEVSPDIGLEFDRAGGGK